MARLGRRQVLGTSLAAGLAGRAIAARAAAGPIRIGFATAISGPVAIIGNDIRLGAELAVAHLNAQGGVLGRPIELVVRDSKASPTDALAAIRELLGSDLKLVVGGLLGFEAAAQAPVVREAGGLLVIQGTQAMQVTHDNYTRSMFRTSEDSWETLSGFVQLALDRYSDVTEWVFFGLDSEANNTAAHIFQKLMTDAYAGIGKQVHFSDPALVKMGGGDVRNQLSQIMASPAQGIYSLVYGQDGISAYTQARSFGLQNKIKVVFDNGNEIAFAKTMKNRVMENFWITSPWYHGLYPDNRLSTAIYDAYVARTGDKLPQGWLHFGSAPIFALAAGVAKAGTDTDMERIIAALESEVEFQTLKGPAHFRADHQIIADLNYLRYAPTDDEQGFRIAEARKYPGAKMLEPPAPGKPFSL